MIPTFLAALALVAASPAAAPGPVSTPVLSTTTTWTGQPYSVPSGPLQVVVQTVEMPVGGGLGVHKHPFPRLVYVESGRLRVINDDAHMTQEFAAGSVVVEAIDQWHHAEVVGDQPVRLLVIDQVPPGQANMMRKDKP